MDDTTRFEKAKLTVEEGSRKYNIGTYKERSKHRMLKFFYEPDQAFHEVPYKGYIADILNDKGITEIQTAGFHALQDKLAVFLTDTDVRVVYPVSERRRICWIDPNTAEMTMGRYTTYPKAALRILSELLSIVDHFGDRRLSIELVYLSVCDHRLLDGYGADRKKKGTKLDTVPEQLLSRVVLKDRGDIMRLLALPCGSELCGKDLSRITGLKRIPLWRCIKFLEVIELICPNGKKGNSIIYKINNNDLLEEV